MCQAKDEFVNDPVRADRPADEFQCGVGRVVEDEILKVEFAQSCSSDSPRHLVASV